MSWRRYTVASIRLQGRRMVKQLAVDYALEHSFVRDAVVPERKLVTEALKRGLGAVTVE